MTSSEIAELNFQIKKGSRTVKTWVAFSESTFTTKYSLSAYDTAELVVYDEREGTILFTVTGTITQGTSTIEIIFAKSDTVSLANNCAFYTLKLSASGDSTLDWIPFEGTIGFIN